MFCGYASAAEVRQVIPSGYLERNFGPCTYHSLPETWSSGFPCGDPLTNFRPLSFTLQVHSPGDLLSLCCTSSNTYHLAIPHLYSTLTIRSPYYYGEGDGDRNGECFSPSNLIPIDALLPPIGVSRVRASRKRAHMATTIPLPKRELLCYVKDLRIEKWEGWNYPPGTEPPGFDYVFPGCRHGGKQLVVQMDLNSKGLYRLCWRRCETKEVLGLHQVLSELLRHHMPSLEKFWYVMLFIFMYWPLIGTDIWAITKKNCVPGYSDEEIVTIHSVICQYQ